MKINIEFIESGREIPRKERLMIKKTVLLHAKKAARVLKLGKGILNFTVYFWERDGVSGFTQAKDWIRLAVNYRQFLSKKRRREMIERLIYIVYHEIHHAVRGYVGFLPMKKHHVLINSIVSEGLADIFAREQYPSKYVWKVTAYNMKELKRWIPKLKKIKWQKESFRDPWLHGGQSKPKLLGYKVGRYIVENVKRVRPELNAVKLVRRGAKEILKLSKIKM